MYLIEWFGLDHKGKRLFDRHRPPFSPGRCKYLWVKLGAHGGYILLEAGTIDQLPFKSVLKNETGRAKQPCRLFRVPSHTCQSPEPGHNQGVDRLVVAPDFR